MDERREVFLKRKLHLRREIQSIFDDAYHWNLAHMYEDPIDPDPDGELRLLAQELDRSIAEAAELNGEVLP